MPRLAERQRAHRWYSTGCGCPWTHHNRWSFPSPPSFPGSRGRWGQVFTFSFPPKPLPIRHLWRHVSLLATSPAASTTCAWNAENRQSSPFYPKSASLRGWHSLPDAPGSPILSILANGCHRARPGLAHSGSPPPLAPQPPALYCTKVATLVHHVMRAAQGTSNAPRHPRPEEEERASWYGIEGKIRFVPLWKWLTRDCR